MFTDAWLSLEMMALPEETRFKKLTAYPSCYRLLDSKWWGFMFTSALHAAILSGRGFHGDCAFCHKLCQFKCSPPPPPLSLREHCFLLSTYCPWLLYSLWLSSTISLLRGECSISRDCSIQSQAFLRLFLYTSSLFVTLFVNLLSAAKEASWIKVQRCINLWVKQ